MTRFLYLVALVTMTLSINKVAAQIYYTENGHAQFDADMTFGSYRGVSKQLEGEINLENKSVHFRVPIESIDTGNGKRNRDMNKLMNIQEYPYAEFKGEIISEVNPNLEAPQKATVEGVFSLRGVENNVTINGTIEFMDDKLQVEAAWDLYITEYGIDPPRFLINVVDDKHIISINAYLFEVDSDVSQM